MKNNVSKPENVLYFPFTIKFAAILIFCPFNTLFVFAFIQVLNEQFSIVNLLVIFFGIFIFIWTSMLVCDAFRKYYYDEVKIWSESLISQPIFLQIKDITKIELHKTNQFLSVQQGDVLVLIKDNNIKMFSINTSLCNYEKFYTFLCTNTKLMKNV